jgi:hypothetical protein
MPFSIKTQSEKIRLEVYAVIYLLRYLRKNLQSKVRLKKLASPPYPDIICEIDGREIGIEVAHLYGSQRDARQTFGRSKPIENTMEHRVKHSMVPLNDRIPIDLNNILHSKAQKNYPGTTWLLIRNAYPLWDLNDFQAYIDQVKIPKCHHFGNIWLLCDQKGLSGAIKLSQ